MKRISQRLISLALTLVLLLGLANITMQAEDVVAPSIPLLALGDSISTGYALPHYNPLDLTKADDSYINSLGIAMAKTPVNLAVDGLTSGGLLKLLESADVKAKLASAEVITISIGGNNVLQPMIGAIKTEFGLDGADTNDQLAAKVNEAGIQLAVEKAKVALAAATPAIDLGVSNFKSEFPQIMSLIKANAPHARILVSTLYNPYGGINFLGLDLSGATQKPIEAINATITSTLADPLYAGTGFEIVDVAKAFGTMPVNNHYVNVDVIKGNFDPHPSTAGHRIIFELYAKLLITNFVSFNFTDISTSTAKNSIRYLAGLGIVGGSNNQYLPKDKLTRGQFVKILKGAVGGANFKNSPIIAFIDVPQDKWYAPYVTWAVQNEITTGDNKKQFNPNNNISRQELAAMLYRLMDYSGYPLPTVPANELFSDDASISRFAKEAVYSLKAAGFLVEKTGQKFNPTAPATRSEAAMILANFVRAYRSK